MKANEVRVGNLFMWGVNLLEIKGISTQTYGQSHNRKHHFYVDVLNNKFMNYGPLDSDEIEPITINEDWLLRFGFEKNGKTFNPPKNVIEKSEGDIGLRYPSFFYNSRLERWMDCQTRVCIDFVHQLQNLYFALMSEELELV